MAWQSKSGAKSSVQMARYDLIDAGFLRLTAERLGYGAEKYGDPHNYRQGASDPEYIRDRENHLFAHVLKFMRATTLADRQKQLSAIGANCSMLAYLDEAAAKLRAATGPNGGAVDPPA